MKKEMITYLRGQDCLYSLKPTLFHLQVQTRFTDHGEDGTELFPLHIYLQTAVYKL
jgi:hypothetical protein